MKLRRALPATAATAALIPVVLAAAPASQAAPAGELPSCNEVGRPYDNSLVGRAFGIPARVGLGEWTTYTATVSNSSARELKSFQLQGDLGSYVYNPGEQDLTKYSDLQYWDTSENAWKTLRKANGDAGGPIPGPATLKPRESVHMKLRFRVHKDLPLDHAYDGHTALQGTFVENYKGTDCQVTSGAGGGFSPPTA